MAAEYQIIIKSPTGTILAYCQDYLSLKYGFKLNDYGTADLTLPYSYNTLIQADTILEINRRMSGSQTWKLEGNTRFFVRKIARHLTAQYKILEIHAESGLAMLKRRVAAYFAGDSQVTITNVPADDAIKKVVRDNFTAATSTYRNWDSSIFSVAPDVSLCPNISKAFAWQNALSVIQYMAQASAEAGTYLFFDIIAQGNGLVFNTFPNQLGVDHTFSSQQPVIFDIQRGNLSDVTQTNDYTDMASVVYCGGGGTGASRTLKQYKDDNLIGFSPYGRIEYFQDARNTSDTNTLIAETKTALQQKIPLNLFQGTAQNTDTCRYGVDYYFGDLVTGRFESQQYDCRIEMVQIDTGNSETPEHITIKLEGLLSFSQVSEQL